MKSCSMWPTRAFRKNGQHDKGSDGHSHRRDELGRIETLIASLKNESLSAPPVAEGAHPEEKREETSAGHTAFEDKLVQEVVRMILEAIYEGHFENTSHGFRPGRSCHTALLHIQKTFTGRNGSSKATSKGSSTTSTMMCLIQILRERISDDSFIRLIRKFLKAGYVEDWMFHNTYSGTPQGGIVSPILANIYLDKLDKYVREYINTSTREPNGSRATLRQRFDEQRKSAGKKLKNEKRQGKRRQIWSQIKPSNRNGTISKRNEMDSSIKDSNMSVTLTIF